MNDRSSSVILLTISIVVLLLMLIPSGYNYGGVVNAIVVVMNILVVLGVLFTIFSILWILYTEKYQNISIAKLSLLITTMLCTILVFIFALIEESISIKFVLIDFVLILSTSVDFVVDSIQKVLQYSKSKTIAKED